jgi:hypothetical protein
VSVAPGGHNFDPDTIEDTNIGDIVEFHFYPKNHSVVRAAYGFPCMPYETANTTGVTGFFSGFRPVDQISENVSTILQSFDVSLAEVSYLASDLERKDQ